MPQATLPDWRETILAGSRVNGHAGPNSQVHDRWVIIASYLAARDWTAQGDCRYVNRKWLAGSLRIFWPWYADSHPSVGIWEPLVSFANFRPCLCGLPALMFAVPQWL